MKRLILSHQRSRSSVLGHCYSDYVGEIFGTNIIDANRRFRGGHLHLDPESRGYYSAYLRFLWKVMPTSFTFKVHCFTLFDWPETVELINAWRPSVIGIYREDRLAALLSLFIADRRGYNSLTQTEIAPFEVSRFEFERGVWKTVETWTKALEILPPHILVSAERVGKASTLLKTDNQWGSSILRSQDSHLVYNKIGNLKEVQQWWKQYVLQTDKTHR